LKDIKKRQYKQSPPVPFNTTDLQAEAYAQFKFSPTQTMSIAESLYQAGFISYPRSSSQKLPPSINYQRILKALAAIPQYKKLVGKLLS
jgi:DNA topoisomerase-1